MGDPPRKLGRGGNRAGGADSAEWVVSFRPNSRWIFYSTFSCGDAVRPLLFFFLFGVCVWLCILKGWCNHVFTKQSIVVKRLKPPCVGGFKGRFRLCPSREEKCHFFESNYVERRSLWAEKYIKIIHLNPLSDFEYFNEKKARTLDGSLGRAKLCSRGRTLGSITF